MNTTTRLASLAIAALASPSFAQLSIPWSTIDGGGGTSSGVIAGSPASLSGTIGQPDAGAMTGGGYTLTGGFWAGIPAPCYANCDGSAGAPALNVNDFICFQSRFAAADPYADCDRSATLNVNDFICFQSAFASGCP